ncbi:hypothetical protein OGAPHI_005631 [Ogataea philodendri]|uniref:K Homology domain-containing protein n=1 Tax=Ogataea philodendri TaxID=1378263 RepID=A0A9P8NZL4_9ASCO|nr:uncharacterized protein OGAPHI_005631 [Ogataea philodendri]KAH3662379.1 hypothetical protein OGAPHI_005631 [Ogataea philodendri]
MLKRKNEGGEENTVKRVARDNETPTPSDSDKEEGHSGPSGAGSGNIEHSVEENKGPQEQPPPADSGANSSQQRPPADEPMYVHFRMLCSINETAAIVGKGGDTINKIKEQSNARVNVSENLKGIPERVITVRGAAEYVAKAFGLITRAIMDEPFNQASTVDSKQINLKLLFPHTIIGYIIGKKGARFREIEDNSAAALKASDQILPASTDRILHITGVADAIHIATYYVAQTVLDHKQHLANAIFYNPANYGQPSRPVNGAAAAPPPQQIPYGGGYPPQMMPMVQPGYMGQPVPQQYGQYVPSAVPPPAGGAGAGQEKMSQDIYVPQMHIGLVIGKGGKNLKDIRTITGCYVKVNDEVPGATERKLTLMSSSPFAIQQAIMLINNKIENEKQRQRRDHRED